MRQFVLLNKEAAAAKRAKPKRKEESLQLAISKYLRHKHPDVIFNSDIASGMRLPIWIAAKAKAQRSSRGLPDMIIMEPKGPYHFFALELKNKESDVYLKDGTISTSESSKHVREQDAILKRLREKNAYAEFGFGLEDCIKKIDHYFSL